jgi:formylglycine-generating enzyme required for sulfatase activity
MALLAAMASKDFRIVSMLPAVKDNGWIVYLPAEAEWEYACQAGTETAFPYGSSHSSQQANFNGTNPYGDAVKGPNLQRTAKVGSSKPNAWGLYDMHGNVLQWCKDPYAKDYQARDKKEPLERVGRGGAWVFGAPGCRAAMRHSVDPATRASSINFRVVVQMREKTSS